MSALHRPVTSNHCEWATYKFLKLMHTHLTSCKYFFPYGRTILFATLLHIGMQFTSKRLACTSFSCVLHSRCSLVVHFVLPCISHAIGCRNGVHTPATSLLATAPYHCVNSLPDILLRYCRGFPPHLSVHLPQFMRPLESTLFLQP